MIEGRILLDGTHHNFLHCVCRVVVVPSILISAGVVLVGDGNVVIRTAYVELQSFEQEVQILLQSHISPDLTLVSLGAAGAFLSQKVEISVCLAAAPDSIAGPDREGKCRNLVEMPPCVAGVDIRYAVGLHEYCQNVSLDSGGAGNLEVHICADIHLGIFQLRVELTQIWILVETACVRIVKNAIVLHVF